VEEEQMKMTTENIFVLLQQKKEKERITFNIDFRSFFLVINSFFFNKGSLPNGSIFFTPATTSRSSRLKNPDPSASNLQNCVFYKRMDDLKKKR
jgi:hypothetical protein